MLYHPTNIATTLEEWHCHILEALPLYFEGSAVAYQQQCCLILEAMSLSKHKCCGHSQVVLPRSKGSVTAITLC